MTRRSLIHLTEHSDSNYHQSTLIALPSVSGQVRIMRW